MLRSLILGAKSTRPYSDPVSESEELKRVLPVIEGLSDRVQIPISIDTSKANVARAAVAAGAEIINDVTGLEGDPEMPSVVNQYGVGVCVMHMQGTPQTMQDNPSYNDVVEEIHDYLAARLCLPPTRHSKETHLPNSESGWQESCSQSATCSECRFLSPVWSPYLSRALEKDLSAVF